MTPGTNLGPYDTRAHRRRGMDDAYRAKEHEARLGRWEVGLVGLI
jgi:hypothetical protein